MPLYSVTPPINKYPKPLRNYRNLFCYSLSIWKSSRSLMPLLPQLVSPAFSPLYDERPGWPPTSFPASSSATPTGLLNFQQPGVCSHMAAHTMSPPCVAGSYFTHPHKQLQILMPFRWFLSHSAQAIFLITQPPKMKMMPSKYNTLNSFSAQETQNKLFQQQREAVTHTAGLKLNFISPF